MALSTTEEPNVPLTPVVITLEVDIDYYDNQFSYRYSESELVITKGDTLNIVLKKDRIPPGALVYIIGFSSTHKHLLPHLEPTNGAGTPFPHSVAFPQSTDRMKLQLNSDPGDMVNFGVHVRCEFTDKNGNRHEYTKLCDPQVGNGPP